MKSVVELAFTLSCLTVLSTPIVVFSDSESQNLVCYLELWADNRNSPANYDISELPPKTCDYLVLFSLTLDVKTYGIRLHDGYHDVEPDELRRAVSSRKRSPRMKVLLAIGGWEDGVAKYSEMLSEKSRRTAFINSAVQFLEEYRLDGLELHWLYPGAVWRGGKSGDKANFVELVKEMAQRFKPRKWVITAGVPADQPATDAGFLVNRLNTHLHRFHVRTFDLRGDWSGVADNHSPLYGRPFEKPELKHLNVNDSIAMWMRKGASHYKLVPIFPLFGRSFTLRDPDQTTPGSGIAGPGKQGPYTQAAGILAYYEICVSLQNKNLEEVDSGSQSPYAISSTDWVGYDNENSLEKKAKFVEKERLAGAGLFAISMDDFTGVCGQKHFLLNKMAEYLHEDYSD